jgi:predicted nucleic acid-binding protein
MTNRCYLDTNVLVYLSNKDSEFHKKANNLLKETRKNNLYINVSSLTLDEFIYSINKDQLIFFKKVDLEQTKKALEQTLSLPNIAIVNPPISKKDNIKIIDYMKSYNLKPRDAYHLLIAKYNNIEYFATFDNNFSKVFKDKILKHFK